MTKYTFKIKNNPSTFYTTNKSTDYSKILDDLILDDVMKKNSWLYNTGNTITTDGTIKIKIKNNNYNNDDNIINAIIDDAENKTKFSDICGFFCKLNKNCPFKKDKIYYLTDGTPFYITNDYITIGYKTYYFYEFGTPTFIGTLSDNAKKDLCSIYVDGLKITIKK